MFGEISPKLKGATSRQLIQKVDGTFETAPSGLVGVQGNPLLAFKSSGAITAGNPVYVSSAGIVTQSAGGSNQSVGTPQAFIANTATVYGTAYSGNTTAFVTIFTDSSNSNKLYAVGGTISGTVITYGTVFQVGAGTPTAVNQARIIAIASLSTYFVIWTDGSTPNGVILTLTGTTITQGTVVSVASNGVGSGAGSNDLDIIQDNATGNFAICYRNVSGGGQMTVRGASVSSTTITMGSESLGNIDSTALSTANMMNARLGVCYNIANGGNGNGMIIVYRNASTGVMQAKFFSLSGTTIGTISGTATAIDNASGSSGSWFSLTPVSGAGTIYGTGGSSGTYISLLAYDVEATTGSNQIRVVALTASGNTTASSTSTTIQVGPLSETPANGNGYPFQVISDTNNNICLAYGDASNKLNYLVGTYQPSSKTVAWGSPVLVKNATCTNIYAGRTTSAISPGWVSASSFTGIIAYSLASSAEMLVITGGGPNSATSPTTLKYVGIAQNTVVNAQTVYIASHGAIDNNQSGLTAGTRYYTNFSTGLTSDPSLGKTYAGLALSTTAILVA